MVLSAGRATDQVWAHAGHRGVRVSPAQLHLDIAIELLEALLAAELRPVGAQKALEELGVARLWASRSLLHSTRLGFEFESQALARRGESEVSCARRGSSCKAPRGWCSAVLRERRSARRSARPRPAPLADVPRARSGSRP